jgi:hypothetical protein
MVKYPVPKYIDIKILVGITLECSILIQGYVRSVTGKGVFHLVECDERNYRGRFFNKRSQRSVHLVSKNSQKIVADTRLNL